MYVVASGLRPSAVDGYGDSDRDGHADDQDEDEECIGHPRAHPSLLQEVTHREEGDHGGDVSTNSSSDEHLSEISEAARPKRDDDAADERRHKRGYPAK